MPAEVLKAVEVLAVPHELLELRRVRRKPYPDGLTDGLTPIVLTAEQLKHINISTNIFSHLFFRVIIARDGGV